MTMKLRDLLAGLSPDDILYLAEGGWILYEDGSESVDLDEDIYQSLMRDGKDDLALKLLGKGLRSY